MHQSRRHHSVLAAFLLSVFCSLGLTLGMHALSHEHYLHVTHGVESQSGCDSLLADSSRSVCLLDLFIKSSFDGYVFHINLPEPPFVPLKSVAFHTDFVSAFSGLFHTLRAPPAL